VQSDPEAAARLLDAAQSHIHEKWRHLQRAAWKPAVDENKDATPEDKK
jgi:hypothetical protein